MHEMSLCEGILAEVEAQARRHRFDRVARIRLEIGRFAAVEPEAMRFAFDVVTRGSLAEGAALEIIDLPGRGLCFACGAEVLLDSRLAPCPNCGSGQVAPSGGTELRIKDMEVV